MIVARVIVKHWKRFSYDLILKYEMTVRSYCIDKSVIKFLKLIPKRIRIILEDEFNDLSMNFSLIAKISE